MAVFVGKTHNTIEGQQFHLVQSKSFPCFPPTGFSSSSKGYRINITQTSHLGQFLPSSCPRGGHEPWSSWATPSATPVSSEEQISQEQTMVRITPQRLGPDTCTVLSRSFWIGGRANLSPWSAWEGGKDGSYEVKGVTGDKDLQLLVLWPWANPRASWASVFLLPCW